MIVLYVLKGFLNGSKRIALSSLRSIVHLTQGLRDGHAVGGHFGCDFQGSGVKV